MAKIDDIDTGAAVRKYLERRVVVDRENEAADSSDEIASVLEATALAFLLYPQAALTFILRAKNILQQIADAEVELLDYLLAAIDDVQNPNEAIEDTSDLVEAQTALVEVDRLGRISSEVRAYDRYTAAVDRFLDRQLAKSIKRRRRGEFERSGPEARQDLFRVLYAYLPTHVVMAERLALLAESTASFTSVDLTRVVATKTITRVRASLKKILSGLTRGEISKTTAAIELLTGAASLQSISNGRQIYDPLVETDVFPEGRYIGAYSEAVAAVAVGTDQVIDLNSFTTPWQFFVEATPFGVPTGVVSLLPETTYLLSEPNTTTINVPVTGRTLYVELTGVTPPPGEAVTVVAVPLTAGLQTLGFIAAEIHAALFPEAICTVMPDSGGRILLLGNSGPTRLTVRSLVPGTFDGLGNYLPADPSVHELLGFKADSPSLLAGFFSPEMMAAYVNITAVGYQVTVETKKLVVRSNVDGPTSGLQFSGEIPSAFGFNGLYVSEPTYLVLKESNTEMSPESLKMVVGSVVSVVDPLDTTRSLRAPVSRFDGNRMYFETAVLPRISNGDVIVISPLVEAVQTILAGLRPYTGTFGGDAQELQRVLAPLLSQPTLAQVGDARQVIAALRARVFGLRTALALTTLREDRNEYVSVVKSIVSSLEERGLDRALEFLLQADFAGFFSLTRDTASKSGRLMKAAETFVRVHLAVPTIEADADDPRPVGTTEDGLLPEYSLHNEDR